jgi:hypothetical protein
MTKYGVDCSLWFCALSVSPVCGLAVVLCLVRVTSLWFGCGSVPCTCHQSVVSSDIEFPNIDDCLENYWKVFTVTVTNTKDRNKCLFPSFLSIQSESAGSMRVNIHRAMNLPWLSYVQQWGWSQTETRRHFNQHKKLCQFPLNLHNSPDLSWGSIRQQKQQD